MTGTSRQIGLAVAGAALAAGATVGMATPAMASAPGHNDNSTFTTIDATVHASVVTTRRDDDGDNWNRGRSWDGGSGWSRGANWRTGSSYSRGHGWDRSGGWGWHDNDRDGDRVAGFYRSYRACQRVGYWGAIHGRWTDFSCDYTGRGLSGWRNFSRFGYQDWRCHGAWVLRVDSDEH